MVALKSVKSVKSVVLLFQLAWCSSAARITASGGVVVVGHRVLVRFLLGSPRQLSTTDGSGNVVASLVVHFRLHVREAQVVGVGVPLAIHRRVQLTQDSQVHDV